MREDWTDTQDSAAYDLFAKFADSEDLSAARFYMRVIQGLGATYTEDDISRWTERYNAETQNPAETAETTGIPMISWEG